MTWSLVWLLLMCCLRMGRLLTRVLLVALLMFAVMYFRHLDIGLPPEILRLKDAGLFDAGCCRLRSPFGAEP